MAMTDDIARLLNLVGTEKVHESYLRAVTGWDAETLQKVLESAQRHVLLYPANARTYPDPMWVAVDTLLARCPWTDAQVLAAVKAEARSTRELAQLSGSPEKSMRLLLRRMERARRIKQVAYEGIRKWVPYGRKVHIGGTQPDVLDETLLALIAQHQPVKLEQLQEHVGRGRIFLRVRVHKLRRAGKVKIFGVDGSWAYTLPGYERPAKDLGRDILLRCEEVEGECLKWDGAHSTQGHALMRYGNNTTRVDIVLWTAVRGKVLKPGYTLVRTCDTPGCCNHAHHKAVTRSEAMKIAFAAIGFGGAKHGRKVSEAVRHKIGVLTPAEVELIRTSELTGAELSIQLGKTKSVVNNVRAGKTYRDYSQAAANPFAGLLGRGANA